MRPASARLLVGRRIVGYDPRPFDDGRGGVAHNPAIVLDNGAQLTFTTEETEVSEYGVSCNYHPRKHSARILRGAELAEYRAALTAPDRPQHPG
jgi:hypothetical protein